MRHEFYKLEMIVIITIITIIERYVCGQDSYMPVELFGGYSYKKPLTSVRNSFKFSHMINNVKQSQGVLRYKLLPLNQYSLIFRDKGITYATGCLENCSNAKNLEIFYVIKKSKKYSISTLE